MITVVFNSGETRKNAKGLWQYDYGQVLRIQGLSLNPAVEIHFALQEKGGSAVTRIGATENGITDVVIPDSMLKNDGLAADYKIYAWIYFTSEESGETKYMITLQVKSRPEPETYNADEDTPVSGGTMAAILSAVNRIAAGKADGLKYQDSILRLLSGDTELARVLIAAGSGTGGADAREIELQKGETAIQWRYAGDAEWTDLVMLMEITGAAGPEGPQGETGPAGADGKSAYQYAVEGGYTGTEEQFASKMADEMIPVLNGTVESPIILAELNTGLYSINGDIKYFSADTGKVNYIHNLLLVNNYNEYFTSICMFDYSGGLSSCYLNKRTSTVVSIISFLKEDILYDELSRLLPVTEDLWLNCEKGQVLMAVDDWEEGEDGIHNYVGSKFVSLDLLESQSLHTTNKKIVGAINELNDNMQIKTTSCTFEELKALPAGLYWHTGEIINSENDTNVYIQGLFEVVSSIEAETGIEMSRTYNVYSGARSYIYDTNMNQFCGVEAMDGFGQWERDSYIGTGALKTTSQTLIGAINELYDKIMNN